MNKKRKVFLSILILALMFGMSYSVYSEVKNTFTAIADFYDMEPTLSHPAVPGEKYVDTVISCNMILKPKTQIHLSRYCESAVSNVKFYYNTSSSNIQKGPDYNNEVEDEIFYPSSGRIPDSYIGGTISYKVTSEFQTRTLTGDKINLETPEEYKTAVIISSITERVDLGVATTISVPTGDQSQPNWTFITPAYSRYAGRMYDYVCYFGSADSSSGASFVSALAGKISMSSKKETMVLGPITGDWFPGLSEEFIPEGEAGYSDNLRDDIVFGDDRIAAAKAAKKFVLQFCEDDSYSWIDCPEEQSNRISKELVTNEQGIEEVHISFPYVECRGYYRVLAISYSEDPSYRPAKRVRVKSRISTYGGFKFGNLKEGDVVKIYNVSGKKVAELNAGTADGFEWLGREGTNNGGDWVKSGIYIYQIKLKDKSKIISGTISFVW